MNCSPPGSTVHGILQARILDWTAISPSSDWPRDWTVVSDIVGRFFTTSPTWEASIMMVTFSISICLVGFVTEQWYINICLIHSVHPPRQPGDCIEGCWLETWNRALSALCTYRQSWVMTPAFSPVTCAFPTCSGRPQVWRELGKSSKDQRNPALIWVLEQLTQKQGPVLIRVLEQLTQKRDPAFIWVLGQLTQKRDPALIWVLEQPTLEVGPRDHLGSTAAYMGSRVAYSEVEPSTHMGSRAAYLEVGPRDHLGSRATYL